MSTVTTPVGSLRIESVDGEREGWACARCDEDDFGPVEFLVFEPADSPNGDPVCRFHKDEAIHDITPYGRNCPRCGKQHSALWPTDEDLSVPTFEHWTD